MSGIQFSKPGAAPVLDMAALCGALRQLFPGPTAKQVGGAAGIPASSVDKWLRGETAPSSAHFAILCAMFGPQFFSACVPSAGWAREAADNAELRQTVERLAALLNKSAA